MAFVIPLGDLLVRLTGDSTQFVKMVSGAQRKMEAASQKLSAAGRRMSLSITAPLAAIGAASVKTFADFDDAMTKSTSIMGEMTADVRQRMEDQARAISRASITGADKLAESYFFLASAGKNAEQSIASLGAVEKFSVAGAFDMARATDLLTDAQSALGLSSKDVQKDYASMVQLSDVLIKANTLANASAEQFSKSLVTKSAASLRLLNKDMEEGVAVLAAFADQGIKGELAGEKLSIVLRDLQSATLKNEKVWKALGLRVFDTNGKMLPLADIIEGLEGSFSSMSDQQKKSAATMLGFQERSFSAIQSLFGTSEKIREYEEQLRMAGGTTEEVANKQLRSFSSQMKIIFNNVKDVALEIGKVLAPMIASLSVHVKAATQWWRGLSDESKRFIVLAGGAAAALGPVLVLLGSALGGISSLISFLSSSTVVWVAGLLLAASAIAVVTDAVLKMTGQGNLGILDFINNFRISGVKISTWMQTAWQLIFKGWSALKKSILISLNALGMKIAEFANFSSRFLIGIFKKTTKAIFGFLDAITLGAIDETLKSQMEKGIAFFDDLQEKSRKKDLNNLQSFLKKSFELEKAHKKRVADIDATIAQQFADDEKDLKKIEDRVISVMERVVDSIPEIKIPKIPELGISKTEKRRDQQFEVLNLRRFVLEGPGGLASQRAKKKQKVEDDGVKAKLDELIQVTKQKPNVAILG